jgi:hypothetical protein
VSKESEEDEDAPTNRLVDEKTLRMNKYLLDYSRWDQWEPTDPATLREVNYYCLSF